MTETQLIYSPSIIWLTGLSGAGKTTTANTFASILARIGCNHYLLDGDELRQKLCSDLGFSIADRIENNRRIGELANNLMNTGSIVICATISPYKQSRDDIRANCKPGQFIEVFVDAPLQICEERDSKGLYRKARRGKITNFTGIDSDYEPPSSPELHLQTSLYSPDECAAKILAYLQQHRQQKRQA